MKLFELHDVVLPYQWIENYDWRSAAEFATPNGQKYSVLLTMWGEDMDMPDRLEVEFALLEFDHKGEVVYGNHGITNTGNQFQVLSTVRAIVIDRLKEYPVNCVCMSAATPRRVSVYSKLLQSFLPGWKIQVDGKLVTAMKN